MRVSRGGAENREFRSGSRMNPECIRRHWHPSRLHSSLLEGYYTCVRHRAGTRIRPWIRNASIPITRSAGSRYGPRGRIRFSASRSRESISAIAAPATESCLLHPPETIPNFSLCSTLARPRIRSQGPYAISTRPFRRHASMHAVHNRAGCAPLLSH